MKRIAVILATFGILAGAAAATLSRADATWTYGRPGITGNGGVETQFGERGYGVELWGNPGIFVDRGDEILWHMP